MVGGKNRDCRQFSVETTVLQPIGEAIMVFCVILLFFLSGILVLCTYACLRMCGSCVSRGADDINYSPIETEAEEHMILRLEDSIVRTDARCRCNTRAKAA
jgi:hypothetical protein